MAWPSRRVRRSRSVLDEYGPAPQPVNQGEFEALGCPVKAGAGDRAWRAHLSAQATGGLTDPKAVRARDRIGSGPWHNAKGVLIARNVEELHSPRTNLTRATALDEKGNIVPGRTEKPNKHDILTGSRPDGTASPPTPPFADMTCGNWTKSGADGLFYCFAVR